MKSLVRYIFKSKVLRPFVYCTSIFTDCKKWAKQKTEHDNYTFAALWALKEMFFIEYVLFL